MGAINRSVYMNNNHASRTDVNEEELDLAPMVQDRALVPYDPLQFYLLEIRRYNLLTKEEEVELGIGTQ
jgi:hypothetical protein